MTKDEHIQYWRTTAQHDIESAESILTVGGTIGRYTLLILR